MWEIIVAYQTASTHKHFGVNKGNFDFGLMKKGLYYSLFTAILFVTLEPVSKLIASEINAYAITFWRFIIGAFRLSPIAFIRIKKYNIHIGVKDFGIMTALWILFICISMTAFQFGVKKSYSSSVIALILGVMGILTCSDFFDADKLVICVIWGILSLKF